MGVPIISHQECRVSAYSSTVALYISATHYRAGYSRKLHSHTLNFSLEEEVQTPPAQPLMMRETAEDKQMLTPE